MSVKARRRITVTFSGDVEGEQVINATENTSSPGIVEVVVLSADDDPGSIHYVTIAVPDGATAVSILKPSDNVYPILLSKAPNAVEADCMPLHPTEPDSISLGSATVQFYLGCLNPNDTTTIRLFWS